MPRSCSTCRSRSRPIRTGRPRPAEYPASLRKLQWVNGWPSFSGRVLAAVTMTSISPSLIRRGRPPAHRGSSAARPLALTDRRDASRLARLHRAGELTAIRVPTEAEEAVRDLVRARAALLADRKRAQQRITAVLLRHGRAWRGTYWTAAHEQWIAGQRFGEPALASALAHYRAALETAALNWTQSRTSWRSGRPGRRWRPRWPGWAATGASPS
jgi:hypothetical protein